MRKIVVSIACALALASCQTLDQADNFIRSTLPQACNALQSAYAGFKAFAEAGTVKQSTVQKVDLAFEGVATVCVDPAKATTFDVILRVTTATAIIVKARKEAENGKIQ